MGERKRASKIEWQVIRLRARGEYLGTVTAPDEDDRLLTTYWPSMKRPRRLNDGASMWSYGLSPLPVCLKLRRRASRGKRVTVPRLTFWVLIAT